MTMTSVTNTNSLSSLLSSATLAGAASGTGAGSASASQDLGQTFLTLLVAQMNNQNPLDPVDNSELTTQMAQISTVTGINNLNSSISSLLTQLQQSETIQSAQLTGHSVMIAGSGLALSANSSSGSGVSAVGGYNLGGAAQNVTVTITDSSGATVRTMQLGTRSAGFQDFTWDGTTNAGTTAAAGNYQFTVAATSATGAAVTATAYNLMTVVGSVPQSNGSTQLMLNNGTQVPYSAIEQII